MSTLDSTQLNYYKDLIVEKEREIKNTIEAMDKV